MGSCNGEMPLGILCLYGKMSLPLTNSSSSAEISPVKVKKDIGFLERIFFDTKIVPSEHLQHVFCILYMSATLKTFFQLPHSALLAHFQIRPKRHAYSMSNVKSFVRIKFKFISHI